jgi:hypothetical protein
MWCYFLVFFNFRSHMLQADSEDMLNAWTQALQSGIRAAIQKGMSTLPVTDALRHGCSPNQAANNNRNQPNKKIKYAQ